MNRDFELVELWSATLPRDFALTGASGDGNEVIAWSSTGRVLRLKSGRIVDSLVSAGDRTLRYLAAGIGRHGIELVDRAGTLRRFEGNRLVDSASLAIAIGAELAAASFSGGKWKVAEKVQPSLTIVEFACVGADVREKICHHTRTELMTLSDQRESLEAHLASSDSGFVVNFVNHPFGGLAVRNGSRTVLAAVEPPAFDVNAAGRDEAPYWVALPALHIREGFVQVLADLRSDSRLIVRRSRDGSHVRSTAVESPIGLIGTSGTSEEVYGARSIDSNELVVYAVRPARLSDR